MKTQTATILAALLLTVTAKANHLLPMNFSEKASYQITALVKKGSIDKSFLLDISKVTLKMTADGGAIVTASSSSLVANDPNTVQMTFGHDAKLKAMTTHFTAVDTTKTVFPKANSDVVWDLGSEAVVDFQKDSADIAYAAANAQEIIFEQNGTVVMSVKLADKRTFEVVMDLDGKVISKKMK